MTMDEFKAGDIVWEAVEEAKRRAVEKKLEDPRKREGRKIAISGRPFKDHIRLSVSFSKEPDEWTVCVDAFPLDVKTSGHVCKFFSSHEEALEYFSWMKCKYNLKEISAD